MANKDSYYTRSKYRKKYDLPIAFLFSIFFMLLLLGLMYFESPHDDFFSTPMEVQIPIDMGKIEDMMQAQLQESSPPEGFTQPSISLVDEIASKVMDDKNISADTITKNDKDTLNTKLTGSGGAKTQVEAEVEDPLPFSIVEEKPEYPGGTEAMLKFLGDNCKYPHIAKEAGIGGIVIVQFIIERDGSIGDVKVVRGLGGGCNEEAIRVVKLMPKWAPGRQRGRAVRITCHLPVKFNLRPN
jgi:TonB family protein